MISTHSRDVEILGIRGESSRMIPIEMKAKLSTMKERYESNIIITRVFIAELIIRLLYLKKAGATGSNC